MRNLALVWVLATCLLGCGGRGTQGKTAPAISTTEPNVIKIDSVDVFSQTANAMVRIPYSELHVKFEESVFPSPPTGLEVIGMSNGAVAAYFFSGTYSGVEREYRAGYEPLEIELDKEEWCALFNALHNSGIQRWKKDGYNSLTFDGHVWALYIYTKDGDTLISSYGINNYPPDDEWFAFNSIIHGFVKMMKEKKQKLREIEYTKLFERPMSEYERHIKKISYSRGTTQSASIELTPSGTVVFFNRSCFGGLNIEDLLDNMDTFGDIASCSIRLNIVDWLNIVNALGNIVGESIKKNNVDTMEMKDPIWGSVSVYDSTKLVYQDILENSKPVEPVNDITPLPVSEELKVIINGIEAKIKNESD
jgi:hypothetical protein